MRLEKKAVFNASDKKLKGKKIVVGSYNGAKIKVLNIKGRIYTLSIVEL